MTETVERCPEPMVIPLTRGLVTIVDPEGARKVRRVRVSQLSGRCHMSEVCPDCGRVKFTGFLQTKAEYPVCIAKSDCAKVTIARLRSELATLREPEQLEAEVIEAAFVLIEKLRSDALDDEDIGSELAAVGTATDALLAHRQRNNDGNC